MLTWKTIIGFGLLLSLALRPAAAQLKVQDTVIPASKTEQGIQASDIDTHSFFPAIDTRPIPLQTPPENPVRKPLPGGEKSNLPVGAIDKLAATVNPGVNIHDGFAAMNSSVKPNAIRCGIPIPPNSGLRDTDR